MTTRDTNAALMELNSATQKLADAIMTADGEEAAPLYDRAALGPLIPLAKAAELLGIPVRTARSLCTKGEIKAVKVGANWRVNTAALLEQYEI